jgi:hypothetical protein
MRPPIALGQHHGATNRASLFVPASAELAILNRFRAARERIEKLSFERNEQRFHVRHFSTS